MIKRESVEFRELEQERKKQLQKRCHHRKTKIIQYPGKNYPFGRKSKPSFYLPIRKCIEVCEDCGKQLKKWKP